MKNDNQQRSPDADASSTDDVHEWLRIPTIRDAYKRQLEANASVAEADEAIRAANAALEQAKAKREESRLALEKSAISLAKGGDDAEKRWRELRIELDLLDARITSHEVAVADAERARAPRIHLLNEACRYYSYVVQAAALQQVDRRMFEVDQLLSEADRLFAHYASGRNKMPNMTLAVYWQTRRDQMQQTAATATNAVPNEKGRT